MGHLLLRPIPKNMTETGREDQDSGKKGKKKKFGFFPASKNDRGSKRKNIFQGKIMLWLVPNRNGMDMDP